MLYLKENPNDFSQEELRLLMFLTQAEADALERSLLERQERTEEAA